MASARQQQRYSAARQRWPAVKWPENAYRAHLNGEHPAHPVDLYLAGAAGHQTPHPQAPDVGLHGIKFSISPSRPFGPPAAHENASTATATGYRHDAPFVWTYFLSSQDRFFNTAGATKTYSYQPD